MEEAAKAVTAAKSGVDKDSKPTHAESEDAFVAYLDDSGVKHYGPDPDKPDPDKPNPCNTCSA